MRRVPREQHLADHLTKGKSLRKIDDFIRGVGGAHASESGGQKGTNTGGRSAKEDKATTAPTSHDAGRVRAVRGLKNPQADEGADGWNMTSSECVLCEGSGRPTSSWKRGGEVKYEARRPHEKSQTAFATQRKGCTEKQASQQNRSGRMEQQEQSGSSGRWQHVRQRKAGTL